TALAAGGAARPQPGVQYRAHRGAGAGKPDGTGAGHRHLGPGSHREPRCPYPRRLSRARRRALVAPYAILARGAYAGLQAGAHETSDGGDISAAGTNLLTVSSFEFEVSEQIGHAFAETRN